MASRKTNPSTSKDSTATLGFEVTAGRGSAFIPSTTFWWSLRVAKDNLGCFDFVHLRCGAVVLAYGSMSSNQSGDCPVESASFKPKAKPQSLPRQRDIRRALIEADLVDTALRDSAIPQCEPLRRS